MIPFLTEINAIVNQIVEQYKPVKILLFGSCAKGRARKDSDIDLCIIMNFEDKRKLRQELMLNIESDRDIDFVLYTEKQWQQYKDDTTTFANLIYRTGVKIYG